MGELRDRMEQDMRVRDFSVRTIEAYVAAVRGLAKYYRKAPDTLSDDGDPALPPLRQRGAQAVGQ